MPSSRSRDAGRIIRLIGIRRILVPAQPVARCQRVYESLQGRHEVSPLPTPRRCLSGPNPALGFTDVSPVFTLLLRAEATH